MTVNELSSKTNSIFFQPSISNVAERSLIYPRYNAPTVTSIAVRYRLNKGFEMIRPKDINFVWANLHGRHKTRIILALSLFIFSIIDLFLNMLKISSVFDSIIDFMWIIGSIGLLGTATLLAKDSME